VSDAGGGGRGGGRADPLETAARALRRHDRSRQEVDERLARAGVDEGERAEALATLERIGYLDDTRVAAARAAALAGRGYGDDAIRHDLRARGIAPDAVEAALAEVAPEVERAVELVAREGPGDRIAARLVRKGFDPDSVTAALRQAFAADGAEA
jgi:regulatory protein